MTTQENKIHETIQTYVTGYLNAERSFIEKAFHPETRLYCVDNQKLEKTEMKDWIANIENRKLKGDLRSAQLEILQIDITDQAATAKIELHFEKFRFTDYLSLLEINNEWIIVGKIYSIKVI